jgi:hypothetical protein
LFVRQAQHEGDEQLLSKTRRCPDVDAFGVLETSRIVDEVEWRMDMLVDVIRDQAVPPLPAAQSPRITCIPGGRGFCFMIS